MEWVNGIVQGVLVGGLFALFASGLSLIFGVMRLVNIAHGDLIVAAAYLAFTVIQLSGLHPLASLVIVVPIASAVGYLLQTTILNRMLGKDILPPLLVTFGLSIIIQNGLLEIYSADSRRLKGGLIETTSFPLALGIDIGYLPLTTFLTAVVVVAFLQFVFYRTELGRSFRAVSDDPETSQLMGLNNRKIYALAMALCLAVVAIAGILLAIRANFDPFMGPSRLIFGFEAVIIGGLGNLWGTLAGGIILGVAQAVGAQVDPGWQLLAGHVAFLIILALRPQGLFPKGAA
jgi:branched-chain amino acid transport system permease protein